jgi:hypothetical protein
MQRKLVRSSSEAGIQHTQEDLAQLIKKSKFGSRNFGTANNGQAGRTIVGRRVC